MIWHLHLRDGAMLECRYCSKYRRRILPVQSLCKILCLRGARCGMPQPTGDRIPVAPAEDAVFHAIDGRFI